MDGGKALHERFGHGHQVHEADLASVLRRPVQVHGEVTNRNRFYLISEPGLAGKHPHVLVPVGAGIVLANSRKEKAPLPGGETVASTELCVLLVFVGDVNEVQDPPHLDAFVSTGRGRSGDRVIAESPPLPWPTVDGNTTCDEVSEPVVVGQKVAAMAQLKGNHLHLGQYGIARLCWNFETYKKYVNFLLKYLMMSHICMIMLALCGCVGLC